MNYEGNIIRPPSEADSIILQVTVGCSHNRCTFCGAYREKTFRIKDDEEIEKDLHFASLRFRNCSRLFLCDGDPLIMPQDRLVRLMIRIREKLPWVDSISMYAGAKSISRKTDEDLRDLRSLNLRMIHMGLESGDDETLLNIGKWGNAAAIVEQGRRVKHTRINLFVTVLLGVAGVHRSLIHAQRTGEALSGMQPDKVGALSLMIVPGTPLESKLRNGTFQLPPARDMLIELRTLICHTDMEQGCFYANHASNYLPLRVRMPREKQTALDMLDRAIAGYVPLTPEWMRGL